MPRRDQHPEPPEPGRTGPGAPFTPSGGDEEELAPKPRRPAPAPRTPLSDEELARRKDEAETAETPRPGQPGQEDQTED